MRVPMSLLLAAALGVLPAAAQTVPGVLKIKPGTLQTPLDVGVAPGTFCDLVIHDVVVRVPLDKKRPYIDITVRNNGKSACGTPPPNGYNFIVVGEYFIETRYKMPVKDGGAAGFTTLLMQAHENDRKIPDFPQSLKQLDTLKPGQTTTITIATPNGYCVEPNPGCVPYQVNYHVRVDVRFWAGGKAKLSDSFEKDSISVPK
jgi:hypothetical protein